MERPDKTRRQMIRRRLAALGEPCAICGKPIDYSLTTWTDPKDGKVKRHPLSFEYDHAKPFAQCVADCDPDANTFGNAQAVHRICNQRKGDARRTRKPISGGVQPNGGLPNSRAW